MAPAGRLTRYTRTNLGAVGWGGPPARAQTWEQGLRSAAAPLSKACAQQLHPRICSRSVLLLLVCAGPAPPKQLLQGMIT